MVIFFSKPVPNRAKKQKRSPEKNWWQKTTTCTVTLLSAQIAKKIKVKNQDAYQVLNLNTLKYRISVQHILFKFLTLVHLSKYMLISHQITVKKKLVSGYFQNIHIFETQSNTGAWENPLLACFFFTVIQYEISMQVDQSPKFEYDVLHAYSVI